MKILLLTCILAVIVTSSLGWDQKHPQTVPKGPYGKQPQVLPPPHKIPHVQPPPHVGNAVVLPAKIPPKIIKPAVRYPPKVIGRPAHVSNFRPPFKQTKPLFPPRRQVTYRRRPSFSRSRPYYSRGYGR